MATLWIHVSDTQRELLTRHWHFYRALDRGARRPRTPEQRRFVAVCQGKCEARTEHEVAYLVGRRLAANVNLTEEDLVRQEFHVCTRDMKQVPLRAGTRRVEHAEEHAVDVDRFSSRRRWVRRYNW